MWAVAAKLVDAGALTLPRALAAPAEAKPEDLSELLVLVRRPGASDQDREEG